MKLARFSVVSNVENNRTNSFVFFAVIFQVFFKLISCSSYPTVHPWHKSIRWDKTCISLLYLLIDGLCNFLETLFVPVLCVFAVKIMDPIANAVLLIESCSRSAHVRNTTTVFVTHVKQHALEFLIGVKSKRTTRAIEIKRHVRKLLPALGLKPKTSNVKNE